MNKCRALLNLQGVVFEGAHGKVVDGSSSSNLPAMVTSTILQYAALQSTHALTERVAAQLLYKRTARRTITVDEICEDLCSWLKGNINSVSGLCQCCVETTLRKRVKEVLCMLRALH